MTLFNTILGQWQITYFLFFGDWKGTIFRLTINKDYIIPEEELDKLSWRNTRMFSWIFLINLIFDVTFLINYYEACSQYNDFLDSDELLTPRLLNQCFTLHLECSHSYKQYIIIITDWFLVPKYQLPHESFPFYVEFVIPPLPTILLPGLTIWETWRVSCKKQNILPLAITLVHAAYAIR